jgi:D-alanyl-D-alanine carboxypeptidase
VLSPQKQAAAKAGTITPTDVTQANPSWAWSAGAGISTADDLVKYVQALVGGGLLSPEMQRTRMASVKPVDPKDPQSPAGFQNPVRGNDQRRSAMIGMTRKHPIRQT